MSTIKLVNCDMPYKKIMQGPKWIGRVYKNEAGGFTAIIGRGSRAVEAGGSTEHEALLRVVTRHLAPGRQPAAELMPVTAEELAAARERWGNVYRTRRESPRSQFLRAILGTLTGRTRH